MTKPLIETMLNTSALALTAYSMTQITQGVFVGYVALAAGFSLEFIKYWGRKKKLW